MSHITSIFRVVLIVIPTLWLFAGCKPVADTANTPLPTQGGESDVPLANETGDTEPNVTSTDDTTTRVLEPTDTGPTDTGPTDTGPTDTGPTDTGPTDTGPTDTGPTDTESPDNESTDTAPAEATDALPLDDEFDEVDEVIESTDDEAVGEQVPADSTLAEEAPPSATLTIGSVAPPMQISGWFKGDAVDDFTAGRVYVVEFWATWCGPCRTSMPHISQLQTDNSESVTFVGVTQEDEGTVSSFMAQVQDEESGKTWDEVVQYTIALDSDGATSNAYMRAAEQSGIPTAFIVGKDGHVEWIGHPMSIDEPIAKVITDDWDREAALAKFEADRAASRAQGEVSAAVRTARQTGDWTEVIQMVEKMVLKNPDSSAFKILQFNVLMTAEKYDEVNRLADELSHQVWDDAIYLNRLAWQIATRVPEEQRNLDLALKIALRAGELADGNASVLDTVARVYFEMGDRDAAIQWQKQAVEAAPDNTGLRDTLEKFEAENAEAQ